MFLRFELHDWAHTGSDGHIGSFRLRTPFTREHLKKGRVSISRRIRREADVGFYKPQ